MRRLLAVVLLLALSAAACGGEPEPEPTPEPTVSPSPEPEPVLAPLTGTEVDDESVLERAVVAVKIDNAPPARPQAGLNDADIVIEELVEGGTTRFIALYHSTDPTTVGPVRSGRDVDADLLAPFEALFVISGAAPPTYRVLRESGMAIREEGQPAHAFTRDRARRRPNNLFVDVRAMFEVAADLPPAERPWAIAARTPGGERADAVTMRFSPGFPVRWSWDGETWSRQQSGVAHETTDGQVTAANVVVVRVPVTSGGGVDVAGAATTHMEVVGEGDALILRDGVTIAARWRKAARDAQFTWRTPEGRPIALAPGRTWIELLPQNAAVETEVPQAEPGQGDGGADPAADGRQAPLR